MNEAKKPSKEVLFDWRGIAPDGQMISGDIRAPSQAFAKLQLASQGIQAKAFKPSGYKGAKSSVTMPELKPKISPSSPGNWRP